MILELNPKHRQFDQVCPPVGLKASKIKNEPQMLQIPHQLDLKSR
uniref:Uncharacterized protein n=1 Tax=Arundo donax TaxID=35708 RepID=A0A0A8Y8Y4_ARUDO